MKLLNKYLTRRFRRQRLLFLVVVTTCGLTWSYLIPSSAFEQQPKVTDFNGGLDKTNRHLLALVVVQYSYIEGWNDSSSSLYPKEVFDIHELRQGAVLCHVVGLIYMFIAIAIVCDEFFVPALEVIIDVLNISEDVAGATFMAAGGSAPELSTSLVGVFIAKDSVGIGTIVGSAVFNILFVIGMCSFFSKGVLELTWWPLARDVSFYLLSLVCLISFFLDEEIQHYEAIILFACYIIYVTFMKFNSRVEKKVKMFLYLHCRGKKPDFLEEEEAASEANAESRKPSKISKANSTATEFSKHSRTSKYQARNSRKSIVAMMTDSGKTSPEHVSPAVTVKGSQASSVQSHVGKNDGGSVVSSSNKEYECSQVFKEDGSDDGGLEEEDQEPMDLRWPKTAKARINYIFLLPICGLLWLTIPDVRDDAKRKLFPMSFLVSILWIGIFAYLMVWWATTIGVTMGITSEIMGLTFLAAGTSIPDLITSVIVAKKGFGDMAVSSSIGSNIFDITVGLPVPWMLYVAISGESYKVEAHGIICFVLLLMGMLIAVVVSIAVSGWRMRKSLGIAMMCLYAVFLTIAILISKDVLPCPDVTAPFTS